MKVLQMVIEKRHRRMVTSNKMQFGFISEKGTNDAVYLHNVESRVLCKGKKLHMCFVDLEKALNRVPRKLLEWAMRKKGIPQVLVRSVMSLYDGAKTRVRVDSELSEEFEVKVGMHQRSVLSLFLFAVVADFTELAKKIYYVYIYSCFNTKNTSYCWCIRLT